MLAITDESIWSKAISLQRSTYMSHGNINVDAAACAELLGQRALVGTFAAEADLAIVGVADSAACTTAKEVSNQTMEN